MRAYDESMQHGANNDPYCYYHQGQSLLGLHRYDEALAAYEQAIHLSTPDTAPQFYESKAIVYEQLAQEAFEQEQQARLQWKGKEQPSHFIMPLDADAITQLYTLSDDTDSVWSVAFNPDGQTLVTGSGDKTIKVWNWQTGQELRTLAGHTDYVYSVLFSPDGQTLVSGSADATIKVWRTL